MIRRRRPISIFSLSVLFFCVLFLFPFHSLASGDSGTFSGRQIHVVYDDSGSMFSNGIEYIPRWSQAKYAMEVFCAMMDEQDEMQIYPMSLDGKLGLTLRGNDKNRVKTIHDMNRDNAWTPLAAVTSAGDALKSVNKSERWLVVLTDGEFQDSSIDHNAMPPTAIQEALDGYNAAGIRTMYLAIGDSVTMVTENPANGAFAAHASDGPDVLEKVTAMGNQIFQKLELSDRFISKNGNTHTLRIDIPTKKIIVFAQGADAAVSGMTLNGQALDATETYPVKFSDLKPNSQPNAVVDESLRGMLSIYESDSVFEDGSFTVNATGDSGVKFYYQPGVEISSGLVYRGSPVSAEDTLYAGDYQVRMRFINPLTNTEVSSELLQSPQFALTVTNNGGQQVVNASEGDVRLEVGDVTLEAVAELPGHVRLTSTNHYTVLPEPIELRLTTDPETVRFRQDQTGDSAAPVLLTITNAATGEKLTKEQSDAAQIVIEDKAGVHWEVTPGAENGVWELRPVSVSGKLKGMKSGDYTTTVTAQFDLGNQPAFGSRDLAFSVESYKESALAVTFGEIPGDYALKNFDEKQKQFPVNVELLDEETNQTTPVSAEIWEAIELKVSGGRVSWEIEKTQTPGVFMVAPAYYGGRDIFTAYGDIPVKAVASGRAGELRFEGEGETVIHIEPFSLEEFLRRALPYLVGLGVFLFFLIGYIKKNKLSLRRLNPHCRYKRDISAKRKIRRKWWSVFLPYVSERATVKCHNLGYQCFFPDLQIIAAGKGTFRIMNRSIDLKSTRVNGEIFDDMNQLKRRKFGMNMDIQSLDKKTGKPLGTFSFK